MESETKPTVFKPSPSEAKGDATTRAARAIIDQERVARDAKTARLKAARLARDAEEGVPEPVAKPAKKPVKKPAAASKPKKAAKVAKTAA